MAPKYKTKYYQDNEVTKLNQQKASDYSDPCELIQQSLAFQKGPPSGALKKLKRYD